MKKLFFVIFAFYLAFFCNITINAEPSVSAKSAVVIDLSAKRILYEKDAFTKRGMASTTKIMTALIAIENLKLDEVITVSPYAAGTEGSSIWLSPGENMSVNDLLYGLMLASGNDAATALAESVAGSEAAFTLLMNKRAAAIGANNTNFTNPHGLPDENHYTTAYDLALISAEAMENELFRQICATQHKTISWEGSQWDRSLTNHNKLLKRYEHCVGIKTGFTKKDGRCLVSAAEKDGRCLIAVTLSAPDDWNDHIKILDFCFDKYKSFTVLEEGKSGGVFIPDDPNMGDIGLIYEKGYVISATDDEIKLLKTEKELDINYPVKKGQCVGKVNVFLGETKVGSVKLIAANDAVINKSFVTILKNLLKGLIKQ